MVRFGHKRTLSRGIAATLTVALAFAISDTGAEESPPAKKLKRIEEDWVLLVKNPDGKIASPQMLICLTPDGSFQRDYALLELNHASKPNWFAGGIQLQAWKGETNVAIFNAPKTQVLERGYDRIKFTAVMEVKGDGNTEFSVINGQSRTWGKFGNDPTKPIKVRIPSDRTDLAGYLRTHSVKHTHVTHGAHRVTMMYQRRVRYYFDDGTQTVDGAYSILHRYQNLVQDMTLDEWEKTKTDYTYENTTSE